MLRQIARNQNYTWKFISQSSFVSRGPAMNRSYFDVVLVSLIVASCYLFVAPV